MRHRQSHDWFVVSRQNPQANPQRTWYIQRTLKGADTRVELSRKRIKKLQRLPVLMGGGQTDGPTDFSDQRWKAVVFLPLKSEDWIAGWSVWTA